MKMKPPGRLALKPEFLFFIVLVVCALLYNYQDILFYKPIGVHQWRNSVSAAFPVNYSHGGHFLTPQTNALLADGSTSDVTVVEFPLIYFFVSLFYRVFGINEFWFRIIQVAIGFTGLIYLYKASRYITGDWLYAAFIPLVVFSSPIYVYYLNNFIPDAVALSLTFIGFHYFLKYSRIRKLRTWLVSMVFFLLAGLIKSSSLLPFFAIGAAVLFEIIAGLGHSAEERKIRFRLSDLVPMFAVLLVIAAWYYYAREYSDTHRGSVSAIEIRPIWELSGETIQTTLQTMEFRFRKGDYHQHVFLWISGLIFIGTLLFYRRIPRPLYIMNIGVFIGAVSFTLLFFRDMNNHDYYQINNLFLLVTIWLSVFSLLQAWLGERYRSLVVRIPVALLIVFLVIQCKNNMNGRYSERDPHYQFSSRMIEMYDIADGLRKLGIERTDKVYCTPDPSINISLYLCDQKGRTDYGGVSRLSLPEKLEYMREIGMEYVILGSREKYSDIEDIDCLLGEKVGRVRNTEIFRIGTGEIIGTP